MPIASYSVNSASPSVPRQDSSWREAMRTAIRDPEELCRRLELPRAYYEAAREAAKSFPVFVPLTYLSRMRKEDPQDPLLRQVLPLREEGEAVEGFVVDPVEDRRAELTPGLLQKYHGRALLIVTGACAVHCRYCFRRHFPYAEAPRSLAAWEPALERIRADSTVEEIILSGGDPLTVVDSTLSALAERLAAIPHLRRLRIHTRLPVVIPQRVTSDLLEWLRGTRLTPIVVIHANHPAELDEAASQALSRLVDAGVPVLNQAVLLSGVNEDASTLAELSRRLVDLRVMPYYLHQLDRVAGAAHFEVSESRGREIVAELRRMLPGYATPRYVREAAGALSKTPLD